MMRCSALLFLSGVFVLTGVACSPRSASAPEEDTPTKSVMLSPEPTKPMDIGDVEADVRLEITLDETMEKADIAVEEMRTAMNELNLTRIDLPWPPPEELLLHCEMIFNNDYAKTPVSAEIRLIRDEEVIANEGGILASRSFEDPQNFVVDVFEDLEELPASMLVHAEVELGFFPDENEAALSTETTTKLSNPVRINFAPRPATSDTNTTDEAVEAVDAEAAESVVEEAAP